MVSPAGSLTQQDVAVMLHTTQSRLSKIETGALTLGIDELRFLARKLSISPERLGILPERSGILAERCDDTSAQPDQAHGFAGGALASQQHWKAVRAELNAHRAMLGDLAAELYPQTHRIPGSTALTRPEWLPAAPVEIADIELCWVTDPARPSITGGIEQTTSARPLATDGTRYARYSHALRDLARPRLLDNRLSYRLLDVNWTGTSGRLGFGYTSYFENLDVCEAAAHEFAQAWLRAGRTRPSSASLPLRRHIADSFDLAARPVLPSINTLTIRRDPIDGHRMYLHQRDATAVAAAGGMFHVMPAGTFQPAGLAPAHQVNDFSLWRNIQREYSEEFLGNPEHDGNSVNPIDYEHDEPFRSFTAARDAGDFRIFATAMVLEPLTLWVELLTVAVIAAPAFDRLFAGMVSVNEEGSAVSIEAGRPATGIPFTSQARERLRAEPLSPIARAGIEQAWQHRHLLLAP
ncbi:MAG TPA: helix-turn-helix transcriptional regulator [Pseudonocardiaceae bacterium]|nr:helix-turn-helix transcriptional regulator [Pseudonocardiaceae bacterium]